MSTRSTHILNRALLVAILGAIAWFVLTMKTGSPPGEQAQAPGTAAPSAAPATAVPPVAPAQVQYSGGALSVPVAGVAPTQLTDTFTEARGSGRRHDAIDIMAPRGTPILAAAEGTVEKLYFSNGGGGITIYVRSPDRRWIYYYAHLDRYAPGLAEGQQVRPGTVIGFVGSTGDASPDGPHLHFAVNAMAPGERWWEGTPVNPYPLLTGQAASH
jgi:murein DD-endopeptidase MepM/ murein hydrolase activator NlpD